MTTCVTCGDPLLPERAERYVYCMKPECREQNARPLEIVAVGVNKAAEQYVALTDRTREEMETGRYKRVPDFASRTRRRSAVKRVGSTGAPGGERRPRKSPAWSKAQQDLAVIYRDRGIKPDEIAAKLGVSRYLVTQMLLAVTNRGKP